MSKPQAFKLDKCVFDEPASKKINTPTNQKFKKNITKVSKIISYNNQQYIESQLKVADLIVKALGQTSSDSVIEQLTQVAYTFADATVSRDVLDVAFRASMEKIQLNEVQAKTLYLKNIENARSTKTYNIIFNLKKCWKIFYSSYDISKNFGTDKWISYIITILKFLASILEAQSIQLTKTEAIILMIIYSYGGHATFEMIKSRIEMNKLEECIYRVIDNNPDLILNNSLERLLQIKAVDLISGEYTLVEEVII